MTHSTPATRAGLSIGDEVIVKRGTLGDGYFKGAVRLKRDDGSSMPLFGDGEGQTLWLALTEVSKKPAGPKAGVAWTDAPRGATHYSLDSSYIQAWHKQNEDGSFAFATGSGFTTYPERSQRSVELDKMIPVPGIVTKENLTLVLADMREAIKDVEAAQATVAAKQAVVDAKLETIRAGGFHVVGSRLTKDVPVEMWKAGDIVRCTTLSGSGLAVITVGKEYRISMRHSRTPCITDDVGDQMGGCVSAGCFQFVRAAK